jgi:hypothetical protein
MLKVRHYCSAPEPMPNLDDKLSIIAVDPRTETESASGEAAHEKENIILCLFL